MKFPCHQCEGPSHHDDECDICPFCKDTGQIDLAGLKAEWYEIEEKLDAVEEDEDDVETAPYVGIDENSPRFLELASLGAFILLQEAEAAHERWKLTQVA